MVAARANVGSSDNQGYLRRGRGPVAPDAGDRHDVDGDAVASRDAVAAAARARVRMARLPASLDAAKPSRMLAGPRSLSSDPCFFLLSQCHKTQKTTVGAPRMLPLRSRYQVSPVKQRRVSAVKQRGAFRVSRIKQQPRFTGETYSRESYHKGAEGTPDRDQAPRRCGPAMAGLKKS
jgi:hypothetical protein